MNNAYMAMVECFEPKRDKGSFIQYDSEVIIFNFAAIREYKSLYCTKNFSNKSIDSFIKKIKKRKILSLPITYNVPVYKLKKYKKLFKMQDFNSFYNVSYSCLYDLYENASIIQDTDKDVIRKNINNFTGDDNYIEKSVAKIPIILATDENYVPQTSVTIISILENNKNLFFDIYILVPFKFQVETEKKFALIKEQYKNFDITYIEMKDAFSDAKLNIKHITSPTFYRLMAPSLFPQYRKVIYLDSDVIVEGNIGEFFNIDISGYYIAGVKAPAYHFSKNVNYCKENGLPAIDQYINAGVIIMNLELLRENNMEEIFIKLSKKGFRGQDQDILNGACYGHIKILEYKYNCMINKYENITKQLKKVIPLEEIYEAYNEPVIVHYADRKKPWNNLNSALADRWWKYATLSPFLEYMINVNIKDIISNAKEYRTTKKVDSDIVYIKNIIEKTFLFYKKNGLKATIMKIGEKIIN